MTKVILIVVAVVGVAILALYLPAAAKDGNKMAGNEHMGKTKDSCGGCGGDTPTTQEAGHFVNKSCPIMNNLIEPTRVTPELTRDFNGQKVAFCCGDCPPQWDKLTDDQKQAKLQ